MDPQRKRTILEKLANKRIIYTHLGGRKLTDPMTATKKIEQWLKDNPGGTIAKLVEEAAPGRKPGIGARLVTTKK